MYVCVCMQACLLCAFVCDRVRMHACIRACMCANAREHVLCMFAYCLMYPENFSEGALSVSYGLNCVKTFASCSYHSYTFVNVHDRYVKCMRASGRACMCVRARARARVCVYARVPKGRWPYVRCTLSYAFYHRSCLTEV